MRGDDIFIIFPNKKAAVSIGKIVAGAGMHVASVVLRPKDLMGVLDYYTGGIIVCGYLENNEIMNSFIENIPQEFRIVVVGSPDKIMYLDEMRVHKIAVPLHKADLIYSLEMLINTEAAPKVDKETDDLVFKAKKYLIFRYGLTEEQAHRYLQKKSMETGRKIADIARMITN